MLKADLIISFDLFHRFFVPFGSPNELCERNHPDLIMKEAERMNDNVTKGHDQ